jgi:hypothetical protein
LISLYHILWFSSSSFTNFLKESCAKIEKDAK